MDYATPNAKSSSTPQRPLGEDSFRLQTAFDQARPLVMTLKNSQTYRMHFALNAHKKMTTTKWIQLTNLEKQKQCAAEKSDCMCEFRGLDRRPRVKCPAPDPVCENIAVQR